MTLAVIFAAIALALLNPPHIEKGNRVR